MQINIKKAAVLAQTALVALIAAQTAVAEPLTLTEENLVNPYAEPMNRARLKVEEDRARLDHDINTDADDITIKSDKSQLTTDVHVLSAFTREYNREAVRNTKKANRSLSSPPGIDTD